MTYADIIKKALALYEDRENIAYFYGAKGQVLTDALMDELIKQYQSAHFYKYDKYQLEEIKDFSWGKIGYDCSGFVGACVGAPWDYSGKLWQRCTNITNIREAVAGSLLYKPGHIGIDIGYGYALHIPDELHTIELVKNTRPGFISGGQWEKADYSLANNL